MRATKIDCSESNKNGKMQRKKGTKKGENSKSYKKMLSIYSIRDRKPEDINENQIEWEEFTFIFAWNHSDIKISPSLDDKREKYLNTKPKIGGKSQKENLFCGFMFIF